MTSFKSENFTPNWFHVFGFFGFWIIFLAAFHLSTPLNHDAAWHYQTAFRMLEGDRVGIDIFDINPPMTMWISSIPALISNMTGFDRGLVFKLYFCLVALLSICSFYTLSKILLSAKQAVLFTLGLSISVFGFIGYDFAQREHFVVVLCICYLFSTVLYLEGKALPYLARILIAIIAAIGICIKPYFLMLPILMELWVVISKRDASHIFRIESVTLFVCFCLYLMAIFAFAPAYIFNVLPDANSNYGGFSSSLWFAFLLIVKISILWIMVAAVATFVGFGKELNRLSIGLLIGFFAFFIAALLQKKGWYYQLYPCFVFLILFSLSRLFVKAAWRGPHKMVSVFVLGMIALGVAKQFYIFLDDVHMGKGTAARISKLEAVIEKQILAEDQKEASEVSVFAFIISPRDIHPAVLNTKVRWAHNAGAQVYLPALVYLGQEKIGTEAGRGIVEVAERHDKQTVENLISNKPEVIFVDDGSKLRSVPLFDYLNHYARYERFGKFFMDYKEQTKIGSFRVFVRRN